jgi:SAM-dependent methyltransferase
MGWRVLGLDLSWPMAQAARDRARAEGTADRVRVALAPMDALPVPDRSMDLVIAHGIWNLATSGAQFRAAVHEYARACREGAGCSCSRSPGTLGPEATRRRIVRVRRILGRRSASDGRPAVAGSPARIVGSAVLTEYNLPARGRCVQRTTVIYEAAFRWTGAPFSGTDNQRAERLGDATFAQAPAVSSDPSRPAARVPATSRRRAVIWSRRPRRGSRQYPRLSASTIRAAYRPMALDTSDHLARRAAICRASASSAACSSRTDRLAGGASRRRAFPTRRPRASRATSRSPFPPTPWARAGASTRWGGLRICETMLRPGGHFVHLGDTIYADNPLVAEVKLDDGTIWKNVVTPAKSKVAETLEEYRGNYQYNLLDEHMRRFNARVPQVVIWDGRSDAGNESASGVYLARLAAAGEAATQTLVLLR